MTSTQKERTVKDWIFEKRGNIPPEVLNKLVIKGDRDHIDDCLSRNGWQGQAVAVPVIITEDGTGKILGSKWAVRGQISKATIKASVQFEFIINNQFIISFLTVNLVRRSQRCDDPLGLQRL